MWLLSACADPTARPDPDPDPAGPCVGGPAVVTDIDETLTTADEEWILQLGDGAYDPAMRPDGDRLMSGLADAGYAVFFVTGRGDDPVLDDGRDAFGATEDWLVAHGFPYAPGSGRLSLSDGIGLVGSPAAAYKTEVLGALVDEGWELAFAFGNADSDIDAYAAVGLPPESTYLVGELAGTRDDAVPVTDAEGWAAFADGFLPGLAPVAGCGAP